MSGTHDEPGRRLFVLHAVVPLAGGLAAAGGRVFLAERSSWWVLVAVSAGVAALFAVLAGTFWRVHRRETEGLRSQVKNLESEVIESRERLRTSLSGGAHDISQPLTTLHGTLELALLSGKISAAARPALEEALQHTQSAMAVTRLLREMADADASGAAAQAISLGGLLEEMREDLEILAKVRGVRLVLRCDASATVFANPPDLRRSIVYLAQHALDRSPAGGPVQVTVRQENGAGCMVIADQGPAIPAEDLAHWFEPFYAGHSNARGRQDALRLAIVERTSASYRGSVRVENQVSGGARFVLKVPVA